MTSSVLREYPDGQASFLLKLSLDGVKQEYLLQFQLHRKVMETDPEKEEDPFVDRKNLEDYPYCFNGRDYRGITSLWKKTAEELSKTVYIAADIYGEKTLMVQMAGPTWETGVLAGMLFDGKEIHLVAAQGAGRTRSLIFYEKLLAADTGMKLLFEKLGWPINDIAWN